MVESEALRDIIGELIIKGKMIDCGELELTRATPDKARGKARFLIYLPVTRNYLWSLLWKKRVKLRVFIQIEDSTM